MENRGELSIFSIIPFLVLLLLIATGPLFFKHFWEKYYKVISILLAVVIGVYYIGFLRDFNSVYNTFIEYLSFILLLGALYVTAGGILIKFSGESDAIGNVVFLLIGAVVSNIIGTTGASMLLLRPFIKINKNRISPYHIIFFIFLVSNVGGSLTPIGDPPLFLGFLKGVPFLWVLSNTWYIWLIAVGLILSIFWFIDRKTVPEITFTPFIKLYKSIQIKGTKNFILLLVIILAVFLDHSVIPAIPHLYPFPLGIRELIMLCVIIFAYKFSSRGVFRANEFDLEPIKEVAFLFIGIFITMIPALQLIAFGSHQFRDNLNASMFYWGSGMMSSVLDNAPTYLNFLSAAMGKFGLDINAAEQVKEFVAQDAVFLRAISVACVFFGAMTYIGNGPNFMVKSISERSGITMPSFMTYIFIYSVPVLLPVFTIIWLLFFK